MKSVLLHVGDTMEPDEVKVPKPLDYWVEPSPNTTKGVPTFNKVHNPGIWSSFSYRPIFASRAQGFLYKFHCLPYGCHPFPPNEDDAEICTHGG